MPYEFQGDNLVYKAPAEVAGYTWKPMGQNENGTNPEGVWVQNEGFDPSSLTNGSVDKYGRVNNSLKSDATEAEKRAYALTYGGANPNSEALQGTNAGNTNENLAWWNVDPALEEKAQAAHRASGGNALGMTSWKDYIAPAAIIGGGLATAALAPIAAAAAPAWDAAFAYGGAALPEAAGGAAGAISQALPYTEAFDAANLASQGLNSSAIGQNLASTGLDSFLSADMANLAAQGLSPEAIAQNLAYSYSPTELAGTGIQSLQAVPSTMPSITDALKTANQIRQGVGTASAIAKLINPATTGTKVATSSTGGLNLSQLASLLAPKTQTNDFIGQYKMNQNPFLFTPQGQTVASEGMYDVSGSNPMANALRKA